MPHRDKRPRSRRVIAVVVAVLAVSSLAFGPVRSLASDLLRIFRVQQVQTISLSEKDMQQIADALAKGDGHIKLETMGDMWVDGKPGESRAVTPEQAQAAVDFPIRLPAGLESTANIQLQDATTIKFRLKIDAVNEMLQFYGSERSLPEGIDRKIFVVKIPPVVIAEYGVPGGGDAASAGSATPSADPDDPKRGAPGQIVVGQARSPELVVPDGVDPAVLRDVLVNLPFLPEDVRRQLASVDDWQNTILIPDIGGSAREVVIEGVKAVVSGLPDGEKQSGAEEMSTVVWNQDGVVRGVSGTLDEKTALDMAASMIR